jgi:hypothetical protein
VADAAAFPRSDSFGPPVSVACDEPADEAADWPRSASFGPPVWLTGETLPSVLELPDDNATTRTVAVTASIVTMISSSRTERIRKRTGVWGCATLDISTSLGLDGLDTHTVRIAA